MEQILKLAQYVIYAMMAAAALGGVWFVILLWIRTGQKSFSRSKAADFLDECREHLNRRDYDAVVEMCDQPRLWAKAVPQLVIVAVQNRDRGTRKLRQILAEKFERDVLADLEYRTSWINTIVKSAPMLGLLGTVVGMINAFAKIASAQSTGTDPSVLAQDISFALTTTALGLTIAIPLVLAGNLIQVRIGKLQDAVQEDLGVFLDDLAAAEAQAGGRQS